MSIVTVCLLQCSNMFFYSNHRFVYRVFMHFPSSWDLRPQLMAVSGQPCPYQTTQVGFSLKLVDPQTWTRYTTNERGCFFLRLRESQLISF